MHALTLSIYWLRQPKWQKFEEIPMRCDEKSPTASGAFDFGGVFNVQNSPSINVSAMFEDLGDQITQALNDNLEQLFDGLQRIADIQAERSAAV
jgi:hypothetical protein